jgi:hypothetical protein
MITDTNVRDRCAEFTDISGINVSDQAQVLIKHIINSVILDPHPTWQDRTREHLEAHAFKYETLIPEILNTVVLNQGIDDREARCVTTFDILVQFYSICDLFCFESRER